ncbi:hypothetical protein P3T27_006478 [Kitasatospora sp. MAA19]|nr:hypothetical protein [Kitasatospora sp. MAA19]
MSGTVHPHDQGRWRDQRGRASRGPNRALAHPLMPPPDDIPPGGVPVNDREEENDMPQDKPSGGSGGIGGPKAPPRAPKSDPPPPPPE